MGKTITIGRVSLVFQDEWDSATPYVRLDVVVHEGTSYIVTAACTGVEPPNETYYTVLAEKGDTGDTGNGIASIVQTTTSSESEGANIWTVTMTDGTTANLIVKNGEKGDTGNGIASIEQTTASTESSGENVWTVTMTDGTSSSFSVYNGERGDDGDVTTEAMEEAIAAAVDPINELLEALGLSVDDEGYVVQEVEEE